MHTFAPCGESRNGESAPSASAVASSLISTPHQAGSLHSGLGWRGGNDLVISAPVDEVLKCSPPGSALSLFLYVVLTNTRVFGIYKILFSGSLALCPSQTVFRLPINQSMWTNYHDYDAALHLAHAAATNHLPTARRPCHADTPTSVLRPAPA